MRLKTKTKTKKGEGYKNLITLKEFYKLNGVSDETSDKANKPLACYKCKKCRLKLFNVDQVVKHLRNYDSSMAPAGHWNAKLSYYQKLNNNNQDGSNEECSSELYVEPMDWFKEKLTEISGKVNIII